MAAASPSSLPVLYSTEPRRRSAFTPIRSRSQENSPAVPASPLTLSDGGKNHQWEGAFVNDQHLPPTAYTDNSHNNYHHTTVISPPSSEPSSSYPSFSNRSSRRSHPPPVAARSAQPSLAPSPSSTFPLSPHINNPQPIRITRPASASGSGGEYLMNEVATLSPSYAALISDPAWTSVGKYHQHFHDYEKGKEQSIVAPIAVTSGSGSGGGYYHRQSFNESKSPHHDDTAPKKRLSGSGQFINQTINNWNNGNGNNRTTKSRLSSDPSPNSPNTSSSSKTSSPTISSAAPVRSSPPSSSSSVTDGNIDRSYGSMFETSHPHHRFAHMRRPSDTNSKEVMGGEGGVLKGSGSTIVTIANGSRSSKESSPLLRSIPRDSSSINDTNHGNTESTIGSYFSVLYHNAESGGSGNDGGDWPKIERWMRVLTRVSAAVSALSLLLLLIAAAFPSFFVINLPRIQLQVGAFYACVRHKSLTPSFSLSHPSLPSSMHFSSPSASVDVIGESEYTNGFFGDCERIDLKCDIILNEKNIPPMIGVTAVNQDGTPKNKGKDDDHENDVIPDPNKITPPLPSSLPSSSTFPPSNPSDSDLHTDPPSFEISTLPPASPNSAPTDMSVNRPMPAFGGPQFPSPFSARNMPPPTPPPNSTRNYFDDFNIKESLSNMNNRRYNNYQLDDPSAASVLPPGDLHIPLVNDCTKLSSARALLVVAIVVGTVSIANQLLAAVSEVPSSAHRIGALMFGFLGACFIATSMALIIFLAKHDSQLHNLQSASSRSSCYRTENGVLLCGAGFHYGESLIMLAIAWPLMLAASVVFYFTSYGERG